jgi:hypothetical protein
MTTVANPDLTLEAVTERRNKPEPDNRIAFQVAGLWGVADNSIQMPLNKYESFDSGQVSVTIDPGAPQSSNFGVVDFEKKVLRVRYGAHLVIPGLWDVVTSGNHDPILLSPPRAVATDDCTILDDYSGWRALGRLDFLPGSLWAGAGGG